MDENKKGFWKTIAGNVLNVAGDLTPIGGDALKNISKKLLKKDNASADEIQSFLEEHPEAFQEYQKLLREHEKQMYELENQRIKAELDSKIATLQLEVQNKNNELTSVLNDVCNARTASFKFESGVLAPNGKIYGIPNSSTTVLEIDLGSCYAACDWALSPFVNKF